MNIRRQIAICVSVFFCTYVHAQSVNPFIDVPHITGDYRSAIIGYENEISTPPSTVEPDSVIKMTKISKATFTNYYKNYQAQLIHDSSKLIFTKKKFRLQLKQGNTKTATKEAFDRNYSGASFLPLLNLYVVYTVVPYEEVGYANFIDYRTGKSFEVPGCADEGPQDFLLSPQQQTLLTYSSTDMGGEECCIHLIKIRRTANGQRYSLRAGLAIHLNRTNINKLVWINDHSFVMEVKEREATEDRNDHFSGKQRTYFYKVNLIRP